ncbi:MAG: hypothetical protein PHU14_02630 [Methylovulum sp.]|nr:hypothetical protein [Methylovulum sp.]
MNYRKLLTGSAILLSSLAFQGCGTITPGSSAIAPIWGNLLAPFSGNTPKLRWMSLDKDRGSIYAWDSGSNIAFTNKEGKTCVLAASVAKGSDSSIHINNASGVGVDLTLKEEIQKLQEKEKTATALDIALFHYCIAMINGFNPQNMESFVATLKPIIAPSPDPKATPPVSPYK